MPKVHVLPPEIVSKIAAGEVIDRPASIIKELVENAIDAQATTVELSLKQAGKTLIQLRDNGEGIEEADIGTVFQRHSTSKIQSVDDLFNIHSLGFRGEALYSVAAVSDIILRSKPARQSSGWEIHLRGGEQLGLKPCSMPDGTEIEVKEIFFNTPARRKFLKSNTSEMNHILDIFIPYALLYPQVQFVLKHQDKTTLELKPRESLVQRIAETLNLEEKHLLETAQEFREENLAVRMVMGDMNIIRSRRDMQFIFINDRPVQNKAISFHLNNIYRLILPGGSYPFFAVYIHLPGQDIDVNIHPTKREVKIKDEPSLCALLRQLAEATLMHRGKARQVTPLRPPSRAASDSTVETALQETHAKETAWDDHLPYSSLIQKAPADSARADSLPQPLTEQYAFPQEAFFPFQGFPGEQRTQEGLGDKLGRALFIGRFLNKFLLFEAGQSLLFVDQHAAQERITFEKLIEQMQKGQIESQNLLTPYLVRLSPQDINIWDEAKEILEAIGFSSTLFDGETVAIHSYPVLLKDPEKAVRDLLSGEPIARCDHETLARRACRGSVMSGDKLNTQQAEFMREQLLQCRDPFTCPHGRPTVVEISEKFLDRQFLRA